MKQTTLCYLEQDGRYLMLHRVRKAHDENHDKWIGVGGKFEDRESPEDCARREVLEEMKCVALHCNQRRLTPEFAREVKALGYWLFCYTVNDPRRARELFSWGVDGLCTDRLDLVRPSL